MLKNKLWIGIILSIFLLLFTILGFGADYKYTQESGAGFFVNADDKADALEDTNEVRQILEDIGTIIGHSLNDDSYPKDGATGGTATYTGDGSVLTGVGMAAASALTLTVRADGDLKKGEAVYVSGSTGAAYPKVAIADADDPAKIRIIGVAATDINNNATGLIRVRGLLTGVDTDGATDTNPGDEAWDPGQLLYLLLDGSGGYTKTKPTSGRIIAVAFSLYGDSNTDAFVVIAHTNPIYMAAAVGEDIDLRMGDVGGVNKVLFEDYADNVVGYVDSDGKADFTSLTLDTALLIAEGGTNSAAGLANDLVMISNAGAIVEGVVSVTELGLLDGRGDILVTDVTECTDLEGTKLSIAGGVLNCTETDSVVGAVTGIVLSDGGGNITGATVADTYVLYIDGATNIPSGEAGFTYVKGTDTLNVVNISCTAISGTLTGTASVAATGDAAVDFFGAGVDAVTDATTCTDIEGTLLSIGGTTLNAAIPAGHITEAMLDADAVAVGDILTYDDGGVDFLWKTLAELSIASSGANTDITSIVNTGLYVGRDATNFISWAVDNTLTIEINDVSHAITAISTGVGDNGLLVTQGYVDDAVGAAAYQLSDLSDVNTSTPTDKFVLVADGVDFESRAITSDDLSDRATIAMLDEEETITELWTFLGVHQDAISDTGNPFLSFRRKRDGDPTNNVSDNDSLGKIDFFGYHTGYNEGAEIRVAVDGTPGDDDLPTRMEFLTTPDGTKVPVLRFAIDNAGNIKMGDGDWTNYVNVTAGGVMTAEGTATITATDLGIASQAAGDILYFDGTNWVRLAKGTAGQVLTMNAGETAPEWQTP